MGLLDRFKRDKSEAVLPSEVDEYYKSEMQSRRGTSVLMALFALLVTLVVAAGLFFGGRAVYRSINKKDSNVGVEQNTAKPESAKNAAGSDSVSDSNSDGADSNGSAGFDGSSTDENSSETTSPESTPNTGDSPAELPNTGDSQL